ncbi:hypothetical protein Pfo_010456 [Paulownia fortunei]|nr:hypothetical protein Pfo_010456 [Paulownia fortunei]
MVHDISFLCSGRFIAFICLLVSQVYLVLCSDFSFYSGSISSVTAPYANLFSPDTFLGCIIVQYQFSSLSLSHSTPPTPHSHPPPPNFRFLISFFLSVTHPRAERHTCKHSQIPSHFRRPWLKPFRSQHLHFTTYFPFSLLFSVIFLLFCSSGYRTASHYRKDFLQVVKVAVSNQKDREKTYRGFSRISFTKVPDKQIS